MEQAIRKSAGCFVISKKDSSYYVLLQKRKWEDGKIGWVPPKGGVEVNEPEKVAAIRETQEETGLRNMTIIKKLNESNYEFEKDGQKCKKIVVWYLATTDNMELGQKALTEHEKETQLQVQWVEINQAFKNMTFDDEKTILEQIISMISERKI